MLEVCTGYYYTKPMIDMYSTIHIKFSRSIQTPFLVEKIVRPKYSNTVIHEKNLRYFDGISKALLISIAIYSSTLTKLHRVGN